MNRPTLVMAHNKTLAAQLYQEFHRFFPDNAVEYFVSYYDYYQPEAYVPTTDSYIEKEATINDEIDRMRLSATGRFLNGATSHRGQRVVYLRLGLARSVLRDDAAARARPAHRPRSDFRSWSKSSTNATITSSAAASFASAVTSSKFSLVRRHRRPHRAVRGRGRRADLVRSADREDASQARQGRHLSQNALRTSRDRTKAAVESIKAELNWYRGSSNRKVKCSKRTAASGTMFDLEMIKEIGTAMGLRTTRGLTAASPGAPPPTLLDYLPPDALIIVDESHQTVPQVRGMYHGDRSRKEVLVAYGFRLPSALDNRPLNFEEWEGRVNQLVFVSATPGPYELRRAGGVVVEQIIRPTGLVDPPIEVRPVRGQVDDLLAEIRARAIRRELVLVTTLTKRMAEDLTQYYQELGVKVRYLHSDSTRSSVYRSCAICGAANSTFWWESTCCERP